jgi:hypothetical protein
MEQKEYHITITARSFEKMEEVMSTLEKIEDIEIYHHVKVATKEDYIIARDTGKHYEKIKK